MIAHDTQLSIYIRKGEYIRHRGSDSGRVIHFAKRVH